MKGFISVQKFLEFENQWAILSNGWKFVSFLTMQRVILGGEICQEIFSAQGGVWLLRPWRTHLCPAQPQCHCSLCTGTLFSLSWVLSNWLNVGVVSWRYVCLLDQRAEELILLEFTNEWGRMPVTILRSELGCSWGCPVTEPKFRILSGTSNHNANSMLIKWLCRGPFRGSHVLRIVFVCLVRWVSGGV